MISLVIAGLMIGALFIAAVARALVVSELQAWLPYIARWLIERAARRLPEPHNERYGEEWLAELHTLGDRKIASVGFALRVLLHAKATRGELAPSESRKRQFSLSSRRTLARRLAETQERNKQLASLQDGVLTAMFRTLSLRDHVTANHSAAVARYARAIAEAAGCSRAEQEQARVSGLLHDIGKLSLPDRVMSPHRRLDDHDWALVRMHPAHGADVVREVYGDGPVPAAIWSHHERVDGRGYPRGLRGDEIPLIARIVSVADTYDVMTQRDSYREPVSMSEAIAELRRVSGAQLDSGMVSVFIALLETGNLDFKQDETPLEHKSQTFWNAATEPATVDARGGAAAVRMGYRSLPARIRLWLDGVVRRFLSRRVS